MEFPPHFYSRIKRLPAFGFIYSGFMPDFSDSKVLLMAKIHFHLTVLAFLFLLGLTIPRNTFASSGGGSKSDSADFLKDQATMLKGMVYQSGKTGLTEATKPFGSEITGGILGYSLGRLACNAPPLKNVSIFQGSADICGYFVGGVFATIGVMLAHGPVRLATNMYWGFWQQFGYYRRPDGIEKVHPRSKKYPDGAIPYEDLVFDPSDPASIKIRSTVKSMLAGNRLRNAIYYGDAGTGKSSAVQSFSHIPGYEVYSISGSEMTLEEFQQLTRWLRTSAKSSRKILVDISEADNILFSIATDQKFKIYFKQFYAASQENFALFFSCNYNREVNVALATISKDQALARRIEDRIRFSVPSAAVRVSLLLRRILEILQEDKFINDTNMLEFFEQEFFDDTTFLRNFVIPGTQGLSHSQVLILGEKLVYLYLEAREELEEGIPSSLKRFQHIDTEQTIEIQSPKDKIKTYLSNRKSEDTWLREEKAKLIKQDMDAILEELPLLELQAKYRSLREAARTGNIRKKKEAGEAQDEGEEN